ncbi:MAG: type VI protein secretion system component VasF [Chlamydiales bacterium]
MQLAFSFEKLTDWEPLQKELFSISNGGESFYDELDKLLNMNECSSHVLEIFYFCLNRGFRGTNIGNEAKIQEYLKKIRDRLPISTIEIPQQEESEVLISRSFDRMPLRYYLAGLTTVFTCYALFFILSLII